MKYKIIYHDGEELSLKTKVKPGLLTLGESAILIAGPSPLEISFSSISYAVLFRLHGLGQMIKLTHDNRTIFLTVVRLNLFNYFAIINFFRAGELFKQLQSRMSPKNS
jgi:hypothetical protein